MPIYQKAEPDVVEQMQAMLDAHHPGLRDAMVRVDVVMAFARKDEQGQPMGPALKKGGVVLAGYAKILGLKDRVMGRGDGEIVVDGDRWPTWSRPQQNALLDHELNHFELREDAKGACVRDEAGRPLLRIRPHDWDFGWFNVIAERHGDASFERQQAERVFTACGQLLFPFAAGVSRVERAEKFLAGKNHAAPASVTIGPHNAKQLVKNIDAALKDRGPRGVKAAAKDLSGGASSMPPA